MQVGVISQSGDRRLAREKAVQVWAPTFVNVGTPESELELAKPTVRRNSTTMLYKVPPINATIQTQLFYAASRLVTRIESQIEISILLIMSGSPYFVSRGLSWCCTLV